MGNYTLLQCGACKFVWLANPGPCDPVTLYEDEEYYSKKGGSGFSVDGDLSAYYAKHRLQPIVDFLAASGKQDHIRHLDLGCSAGHFLALAGKRGWQTEGVEASPVAAATAQRELGLKVRQGRVEDASFDRESFDVISIFHVLEHLADPRALAREIHSWLKDDGVLVLEVPNIRSLPARLRKGSWHGYVLPYHLWHFSAQTMGRMLEEAGFRVALTKTPFVPFSTSRILNFHRVLAAVYRFVKPRPAPSEGGAARMAESVPVERPTLIAKIFRLLYWPTDQLMSLLGFGENIYIVALKK